MKASLTNLAAAGLILAGGAAVFGATGAAAGLRSPVSAHPAVSASRGEHHAMGEGRRRHRRGYGSELDLFGAAGPTEGETPAGEEEEAPRPAVFCPSISALGGVAADYAGPRIIEIGSHAPAARRGPLPVVVYGDFSR